MLPIITLVGRPNVGKSTLFNRFTRTQDALVANFAGLTRDRQYGQAEFNNKQFIVVDTGGIGVDDLAIDSLLAQQSNVAIIEAQAILLVVDARAGLSSQDEDIAQHLRKMNKPIYLVVNKIDGLNAEVVCADFQALGLPTHPISATHGRGIRSLLTSVTADFQINPIVAEDTNAIKIAFIGRPNVGKSTLINRLLGEERVVVYDEPGTTRDSITIPFARDDKSYILIDTAGIRRRPKITEKIEKFSVIKTLQSIKEAQVCILLLDAQVGVTDQDLRLLGFIVAAGKSLVIAVNKWDGLTLEHKQKIKADLARSLQFANFAHTRFISALHGSGVGKLLQDVEQAYSAAMKKLSTPKLTKLLEEFVSQHAPPLIKGRRIKLRYAHAGGHNPPIIVIHGNQLRSLPQSYIRYLTNAFIQRLGLIGTPVKLEFKTNINPFKKA